MRELISLGDFFREINYVCEIKCVIVETLSEVVCLAGTIDQWLVP